VFSNTRKQAQQIAQQMVAGHCGLVAWWTLKHAGVLEAMQQIEKETDEGLLPLHHAIRTNMSPDVLEALLDYAATAGLVTLKKDGARLTPEGKAILEHEDGVLELMRAYQPVLDMSEHLLAKLKGYAATNGGARGTNGGSTLGGVSRKSEYWVDSQAKRYPAEVFPAVADVVAGHKLTHLLDIACGAGDLLLHAASRLKKVVGVGIGNDGITVRRANTAITAADLESRLIAVNANPIDVCLDTKRIFDRIGISRQLWEEVDGLVAMNVFSEITSHETPGTSVHAQALAAIPKNFPKAKLLLIEPVASEKFNRNYYAPELALLLRLSRSAPWPAESWREAIAAANMKVVEEVPLVTDGLTIFVCKPTPAQKG
jgi:SAM-dependent methyltransferase